MHAILPVGLSILLVFLNVSCSSTLLGAAWHQGWGPCCRLRIDYSVFIDMQRVQRIILIYSHLYALCAHVRVPVLISRTTNTVLCSWARHLTLTVPLSIQVYKWVPANFLLGVTLRWSSIPSRGEWKYS